MMYTCICWGTRTPVIQRNPYYVPWYLREQPIWGPPTGSNTPTPGPLATTGPCCLPPPQVTGLSESPQELCSVLWEQIQSLSGQVCRFCKRSLVTPKLQTLELQGSVPGVGEAVETPHDVLALIFCFTVSFSSFFSLRTL